MMASSVFSQEQELEEIVVNFKIQRLLDVDIFVQYDGETVYLPIIEIFRLLGANTEYLVKEKKLTGYIANRSDRFELDFHTYTSKINGKKLPIPENGVIRTENEVYLRIDLFEPMLHLPMKFIFSYLQVTLPLDKSFPAFQKMKRNLEHKRLKKEKLVLKNIRKMPQSREFIGGGVADWSLSANPVGGAGQFFSLGLGGMLLGGDVTIFGSGNSTTGIDPDHLIYRWHYFFDARSWITQAEIGNVFAGGPFGRTLRGGMITNRPQNQRKFYRTTDVTGFVGEGWEVELYVDQKLTDYVQTGVDGRYDFKINVDYGASIIELKMYGPNGEVQKKEQYIRVPYNLIPKNTVEYSLALGDVPTDSLWTKYVQPSLYVGALDKLTIGASIDVPVAEQVPEQVSYAGQATAQISSNFILGGTWSPQYISHVDLNFSLPSFVHLDASFSRWHANKLRNPAQQEYGAVFSAALPIHFAQRFFSFRYYLTWDKFSATSLINQQFGLSATIGSFSFNYLGKHRIVRHGLATSQSISSEIFTTLPIHRRFRPQVRAVYNHTDNQLERIAVHMNRRIFRQGQLSGSIEYDAVGRNTMVRVAFDLFTDFAAFSTRAAYTKSSTNITQVQHGSIIYDQEARKFLFDRYNALGAGTALIQPFMDENFNGRRDNSERTLEGIRASILGGRERRRGESRLYYYEGLNPYDEYTLRIDPVSIDDPTLKPVWENYSVRLNPNMVTTITVPIVYGGEAEGIIRRRTKNGNIGQGGIKIQFLNLSREMVTEVTSFSNGEFFYLGLLPGRYRATIDPGQLAQYGYISEPAVLEFEMESVENGGSIDNLDFLLIPISEQEAKNKPTD